jgi:peptide/nickel transport system permease protein
MARLLARRAIQGVAIVWLVASFTFLLAAFAPGDVVSVTYGDPLIPEDVRAQLRSELCLDRGIVVRYGCWIGALARGDLGYSLPLKNTVASAIGDALPNTLVLMGLALAGMFAVGLGTALLQARRPGGTADHVIGGISMFFYAMPDFWFALILLFVFSYKLGWTPVTGMVDPVMHGNMGFWARLADRLQHLVLPVGTFIVVGSAGIARYQRAALLDVMSQDFIRTARAKGASERRVLLHHVLRNALLPLITLIGLNLPALLGGAVLIETVFAWPGMGMLTTQAVANRDYPLVLASVMIGSVLVVAGSLLADLLYAAADPRVRGT